MEQWTGTVEDLVECVQIGMLLKGVKVRMKQAVEKKNCLISMLLSSALIMFLPPTDPNRLSVKSFGRFIGLGIAKDWDASKIVSNFYGWFFMFALLFALLLLLLEYLLRRNPEIKEQASWKMLDSSVPAAFAVIVFRVLTYFWRLNSFSLCYFFILSIFVLDVIYCYSGLEKGVDLEKYTLIKTVSIALGFTVTVIFREQWNEGRAWLINYYIFFGILFTAALLYGERLETWKPSYKNIAWKICTLFMGLPILTSLYIEALNILNQYSIFIRKPRRVYCVVLLIYGCISALLCFIRRNRGINWKKAGYPLLLSGLACLASQIPLQQQVTPNLFESANSSVLISDFLNFGKLPLVEHYGGHMLKNVVGGIAYAVINQDYTGAVLSPYGGFIYVAAVLLFYFFIRELLQNEDAAFVYTLCLPFWSSIEYYLWGLLICLSVANYVKRHGYRRALLIWAACALAVLYRLDLGTAFGAAAVIVLAVYLLKKRRLCYLKELGYTFLIVIAGGLSVWTVACTVKNISPIGRLREFVMISLSNQNWGTGLLGDNYSIFFAAAYMAIPILCAAMLVYLIFIREVKCEDNAAYYMILILGIAYFVNLPRGLVRHTLNELAVKTVLFSGGLFLIAAFYYLFKKQVVFLAGFILLVLTSNMMAGKNNLTEEPLLGRIPGRMDNCISGWSSEWQDITERKKRVLISEKTEGTIDAWRSAVDLLLDKEDTYIDFMNVSFLYSALGRECPVYVAQSPGHLSGEYTQEAFISEIEERKEQIPLAILPAASATEDRTALDGIANISRYYKVAEYIYQNYRPLCRFDDAAVWCRFEEYKALADRLTAEYELIDYGYDGEGMLYLHDYPMYEIPYLWGTYDTERGWENPVLADSFQQNNEVYCIENSGQIDKSRGNYLLLTCRCDSEYTQDINNAEIILGSTATGEEALYRFRFRLRPGEQQYMIRLSADYYWYAGDIDRLCIQTEEKIENVRIKILQGD